MAASGHGSFPETGNLKGSSEPEPLIHLFKFAGMLVVWPSQCDPSGMLVVWLSQWAAQRDVSRLAVPMGNFKQEE